MMYQMTIYHQVVIVNMITAEHWMEGINKVLDRYGLSREEFWKDPKAFIDSLDNREAKLMLEAYMQL